MVPLRELVVLHTRGRLVEIDISYAAISPKALVEMCCASPLLQRLAAGYDVPALEAEIDAGMRLVRGCPKLIDLLWHLDCDRHVDGQNVDDLLALLKDRGKGNPDQYVEVDGRIL